MGIYPTHEDLAEAFSNPISVELPSGLGLEEPLWCRWKGDSINDFLDGEVVLIRPLDYSGESCQFNITDIGADKFYDNVGRFWEFGWRSQDYEIFRYCASIFVVTEPETEIKINLEELL